ncbi:glycosyltransferase [Kocuria sp.]|uniref:glycosyltransferase n=1 Tax=Kocuria sp. TaxID=1871328 RepID=UPI0028A000C5|nr:glycosyltransferase [Kocuria sp.]
MRANQLKGALRLVREYRRLEPEDSWAAAQEVKLQRSASPSNYQLAQRGFPFPPRRTSPVYSPVPDRVFYLLHNSLPYHSAGYSTRTHGLLTGLRGRGWDVRGVTRLGYPYDMPKMADLGEIGAVDVVDGVPYHRLSTTPGIEKKSPITEYVDRYVRELTRVAREQRPAVIHGVSNHWNGLAAVSAANHLGIPSIYEVRGLWEVTRGSRDPQWAKGGMYRFMARMEADAAASATRVLAITNALKDELVARGVDAEKITVVPNAVDAQRFRPVARDVELEEALGVRGRTVIGYIGSVLDYEGLEFLVDAADVMRARRSDFAVLIVGDGAELEKFQDLVRERELEDFVRFTGRVPHEEVERYYSLVDIAPFPRLPLPVCEMVSPLKPFEALAMGKAVVASDVAALAEIIEPGVNGLLHRKGDTEDLVRQLELLLDDPSLRATLARQGREWVRANRQWSDMAGIVSNIYRELGAEASRVREAAK